MLPSQLPSLHACATTCPATTHAWVAQCSITVSASHSDASYHKNAFPVVQRSASAHLCVSPLRHKRRITHSRAQQPLLFTKRAASTHSFWQFGRRIPDRFCERHIELLAQERLLAALAIVDKSTSGECETHPISKSRIVRESSEVFLVFIPKSLNLLLISPNAWHRGEPKLMIAATGTGHLRRRSCSDPPRHTTSFFRPRPPYNLRQASTSPENDIAPFVQLHTIHHSTDFAAMTH